MTSGTAFLGASRARYDVKGAVCPLCLSKGTIAIDTAAHAYSECAFLDGLWAWVEAMATRLGYEDLHRGHFLVYGQELHIDCQRMRGNSPIDILRGAYVTAVSKARAAGHNPTRTSKLHPESAIANAVAFMREHIAVDWAVATTRVAPEKRVVGVPLDDGTWGTEEQLAFPRPTSISSFAKKWHDLARVRKGRRIEYLFTHLPPPPARPKKYVGCDLTKHLAYTDGSCRGNRDVQRGNTKAGWGACFLANGDGRLEPNATVVAKLYGPVITKAHPEWLGATVASNNTGELCAIGETFLWACAPENSHMRHGHLIVRYDSTYAANMAVGRWKPKSNKRLVHTIQNTYEMARRLFNKVSLTHVKGHSNHPYNDVADELANLGAVSRTKDPTRERLVANADHTRVLAK